MISDNDVTPRLPPSPSERVTIAAAALVLLGLFTADLLQGSGAAKLGVAFLVLAWAPLLLIHEIGHAVAARLAGWHVSEIVIGYGRELTRFDIGATRWRIKLAPVEGYILPSPRDLRWPRAKSAFIYAAGPGAELVVLAALWLAADGELFTRSEQPAMLFLQGTAAAVGLGLFFNLLPLPVGGGVTDGLGVFLSLMLPNEHFRARLLTPVVREATLALVLDDLETASRKVEEGRARHGDAPDLLGLSAVIRARRGDPNAAHETLQSAERESTSSDDPASSIAVYRAWVMLTGADASALPFARRAAERAVALAPYEVLPRVLAGRALLGLGFPREAFGQFMSGYKRARVAEEEGLCLAYLALASRRALLNEGSAAEHPPRIDADYPARFAGALRRVPVSPQLRERVERELAGPAAP